MVRGSFSKYSQQRGLALIAVLFIFALSVSLAAAIIKQQSIDRQRLSAQLLMQKNRYFTLSAEELVKISLKADYEEANTIYPANHVPGFKNSKAKDYGEEDWAQQLVLPFEAKGESFNLQLKVDDAQGKFNLNWLHPSATDQARQLERFRRLLAAVDSEVDAGLLANNLARFLNKDSQVESEYEVLEPPYAPAYKPLTHVSELLLVLEFDKRIYNKLLPFISALPVTSQLNVNTANSCVLQVLSATNWSSAGVGAVEEARADGLDSVDDFFAISEVAVFDDKNTNAPKGVQPWNKSNFTVYSEYFVYQAKAEFEENSATLAGLIYREFASGSFASMYRNYGTIVDLNVANNSNTQQNNSTAGSVNNNASANNYCQ